MSSLNSFVTILTFNANFFLVKFSYVLKSEILIEEQTQRQPKNRFGKTHACFFSCLTPTKYTAQKLVIAQ